LQRHAEEHFATRPYEKEHCFTLRQQLKLISLTSKA
jgi:hypothetical protein